MNALAPIHTGAVVTYADEHDAIRAFAENEKAASTRKAYRHDFTAFSAWCRERGLCPLPADPRIVAWHISAIASAGLAVSSIGRRLAGIAYAHQLARHPNPCMGEELKVVFAGIRRTIGTAPRRKAAATGDLIARMVATCPDSLIGVRNRAILTFGVASAMRRSELVALRVEHLSWTEDGVRVFIPRSKTDQTGEGVEIAVPRGCHLRPVEALRAWLTAAAAGASVFKMAEVSRHKSMDVLCGYVRSANLFDQHAGSGWL
jgi:integrase